jgi:hypothetical protein
MYKLEVKFSLPLFLTSLPLVLLLFTLVAASYEFYQDMTTLNLGRNAAISTQKQKQEQVFKLDLGASLALSGNSIKGLGVDNAEVYVLKVDKKKKGLSSLFNKLKNQKDGDALRIVKNNNNATSSKSLPNYNAFLSSKEKTVINQKAIRSMIHAKTHLFRGCYNRMLIKDGLLSGIATITISTKGTGSSIFKGVGRSKVIGELKTCLNSQVEKIDLSQINLNKGIRFSLNFSS